ncbi:MAG: hypothetical protein NTY38_31505, partial [Acidobacteria bacterium]|nr:hypothetical protein [Acidobacteriota bacterium]
FANPNLLELPGGDFALPYTGYSVPHKYPRGQWKFAPGYAIWPKGRIMGIEATEQGEFATASLFAPGRKLRLNVSTRRAGSVRVEVASKRGRLPGRSFAECAPVIGDHRATTVSWRGSDDLGYNDGEPVFFRFRLDQAVIHGLEFA